MVGRRGAVSLGAAGLVGLALAGCATKTEAASTPNAVARPAELIDVRSYGAVGDGQHNDTLAIQKAIDAAHASGGGVVMIPTGRYAVDSITLAQNVDLLGENRDSTVLLGQSPGANTVLVPAISFSRIASLQITCAASTTAGAAVYLDQAFTTFLDDLYITGGGQGYDGIVVDQSTATFIRGFNIYSLVHDGVSVQGPKGNDVYLIGGIINLGQTKGGAGVRIENFSNGAFNLTDADILSGAYGLWVEGSNYLRFENTYFDSSANGAMLQSGNLMTFSNCWFSNRPGPGLTIGGARGVTVLGGQAANCGGTGIRITDNATGVSLVGVQVIGNNTAGSGDDGIRIEGGANYVSVSNCIVGNDPSIFNTTGQQVGIHVLADAGSDLVLTGNLLFGNTQAAVTDERTAASYVAGNLSQLPTTAFSPPAGATNLVAGATPTIASNSADGQAVTLQHLGSGAQAYFQANFSSAAQSLSKVSALGDWVGVAVPSLQPGSTYLFVATVWGSGMAYLDVWTGAEDMTTPPVTLSSTPQVLTLTVTLPTTGLAVGNATPQIQVRTHTFPTVVNLQLAVYAS